MIWELRSIERGGLYHEAIAERFRTRGGVPLARFVERGSYTRRIRIGPTSGGYSALLELIGRNRWVIVRYSPSSGSNPLMPFVMFYDRFPDLAARETRNLIVLDDPELPPDTYALTELYCDEPGCECRRVMFNVFADRRKEFVAVIADGWESTEYYRK